MADTFDVYLKWLGISPKDQPPHHYRLLGIDPFTDDPDVIETAADQRMVHLRTFQTGERAKLSQQLLNEISKAKVCLLNPEKKAAYDAELKQQLGTAEKPKPKAAAPKRKPRAVAEEAPTSTIDFKPTEPVRPARGQKEKEDKPAWQHPAVIGGVAGGLLLLVVVVAVVASRGGGSLDATGLDGGGGGSPEVTDSGGDGEKPVVKDDGDGSDEPFAIGTGADTREQSKPSKARPRVDYKPVGKKPDVEVKPRAASGDTVDLLKLIDVERDAVKGKWKFENGVLVSPNEGRSVIQIPYVPPNEYQMNVFAERTDGKNNLSVGLVAAGRQFMATLDGVGGSITTLDAVDGSWKNETTQHISVFVNNQPSQIACTIRKAGVAVQCDGKKIIDYHGDLNRLSYNHKPEMPNKQFLFLFVDNSVYHIHKMTLTPLGESVSPPEDTPAEESPPQDTVKKLPIPNEASRKQAQEKINDVFKNDITTARTPDAKLVLAKTLLEQAKKTGDDPAVRYVLFEMAAVMAAKSGNAETALAAIDTMAEAYEIDIWKLKVSAMTAVGKAATGKDHKEKKRQLTEVALALVEEAIESDRYNAAKQLGSIALAAARKVRDLELVKQIVARNKDVDAMARAFVAAEEAFATLDKNPDDPEANLTAGRLLCFVKGDWQRGLPMLTKGSDATLKVTAEQDLAEPAEPAEQVKLGDGWWKQAAKEEGMAQKQLQVHAATWYRKALPSLTGIDKIKVAKRLSQVTAEEVKQLAGVAKSTHQEKLGEWLIIFRSADPRIWNSDVNKGPKHFAQPIANVPDNVAYLKLARSRTDYIIVEMTKDRLLKRITNGSVGWNGTNAFGWNAHRLGVFDRRMPYRRKGDILPAAGEPGSRFRGWGFGVRAYIDDAQGYAWNGEATLRQVFEISVTPSPLTRRELRHRIR